MIVKIFILGSLLFVSMRLLNVFVKKIRLPKNIMRHLDYSLAFIELLISIAFISWVVMLAYHNKNYFILLFLAISAVLFIAPAFILIRDLVFGIFLKVLNKIPLGAIMEIDNHKGKIIKTGHFFLKLEDRHGSIRSYGYYKLNSSIISSLGEHSELEKLDMVFSLAGNKNYNEQISQLKKQLLCTPWVSVKQPIIIEQLEGKEDPLKIKVGLFSLNKKYKENIKEMVEKNFSF